jgi:hypothetical protein
VHASKATAAAGARVGVAATWARGRAATAALLLDALRVLGDPVRDTADADEPGVHATILAGPRTSRHPTTPPSVNTCITLKPPVRSR